MSPAPQLFLVTHDLFAFHPIHRSLQGDLWSQADPRSRWSQAGDLETSSNWSIMCTVEDMHRWRCMSSLVFMNDQQNCTVQCTKIYSSFQTDLNTHTHTHTFMGAWECAVVQHTNVEREGERMFFIGFFSFPRSPPPPPLHPNLFARSPFALSSGVQLTAQAGNRLNQSDLGKQIGEGQRFGGQTKWLNCCRGVRSCAGSKTATCPHTAWPPSGISWLCWPLYMGLAYAWLIFGYCCHRHRTQCVPAIYVVIISFCFCCFFSVCALLLLSKHCRK